MVGWRLRAVPRAGSTRLCQRGMPFPANVLIPAAGAAEMNLLASAGDCQVALRRIDDRPADGIHGLVLCMLAAFSVFLKYAKLWELGERETPESRP